MSEEPKRVLLSADEGITRYLEGDKIVTVIHANLNGEEGEENRDEEPTREDPGFNPTDRLSEDVVAEEVLPVADVPEDANETEVAALETKEAVIRDAVEYKQVAPEQDADLEDFVG